MVSLLYCFGFFFPVIWPMGSMNFLLPAAYNMNDLAAGGRRKQGVLCKVFLTVWFVPCSGLVVDSYDVRNVMFWAPSLRGRIKIGQDADLCSLVTEVWLVCFSQRIADCFCLLMSDYFQT